MGEKKNKGKMKRAQMSRGANLGILWHAQSKEQGMRNQKSG